MGITYTTEQQQVIDLRNRNILVAAAAGSGKTAVLVERIITRLTKDPEPLDVDQLLVVTFTEAAASEMKERIRNAIEKALEADPENLHLQRQATLIHQAQVTTIHRFCLSVIRDYFHVIDLNPGFRIGEEGELKLLKQDTVEELLETYYQEGDAGFLDFVESMASGKDDKKIEELILQLYEYARSYPNPAGWLEGCKEIYQVDTLEAFEESQLVQRLLEDVRKMLCDFQEQLKFAADLCEEEDGPTPYAATILGDLALAKQLCEAQTFGQMQEQLSAVKWGRLAPCRKKEISEAKKDCVSDIHTDFKKYINKWKETYFKEDVLSNIQDLQACRMNIDMLIELVNTFADAFAKKKETKNLIDFGDMEHYALQILTVEEDGKFQPGAVALEYQERFKEIMIDEYQDSNYIQEAILTSVSTCSKGQNNIFMVGDVKQSIYRFRLSRPELFMEKYDTYSTTDSTMQRIDLHKNFRSRREVLDSTNFVFHQIMKKDFGGIDYDERAALHVGASYDQKEGCETEICLIQTDDLSKEENKRELEAKVLANRIKQMVGVQEVLDKSSGTYRKASYRDMVILTRSLQGWTDVFLKVLTEEGIPAYSVSREGYFETQEIKLVLDYLRVLDNPKQDIPLVAVLTSPFCRMSSEELAQIKTETQERYFYDRLKVYEKNGDSLILREKIIAFFETYQTLRNKLPYTAIHALLWELVERTGYANYIAALPGGAQRKANLEMLVEKAIRFESTSYKGLFHFIRYIEQLQKYDVDFGEASLVDEEADVVRLMSIHKSKGLEFPIVFVAGMEKRFNMQDAKGSVVIHPELGIALDAVHLEQRTKTPTILKMLIQTEEQKEGAAEELRILYVAMTRAKEKLILLGTMSKLDKRLREYQRLTNREERTLPYLNRMKGRSYFDWILPALYRSNVMDELLEVYGVPVAFCNPLYKAEVPIRITLVSPEEIEQEEVVERMVHAVTKQMLESWDTSILYDASFKEQIEAQFQFQYPYEVQKKTKTKVSVSELKKRIYLEEEEIEEETVIPLLPKFLQEAGEATGALRGSAYHKVLEMLDFSKEYTLEQISEEIEALQKKGLLTETMKICVKEEDILTFLQSPIGRRMQKASQNGLLHAEQPFVLGEELEAGEMMLVQGIIDTYFEEDGELVVLDYKTDRVWSAKELVERYRVQLEYYAKALEQITGKSVKEKRIYSFALQREIEV